MQRLAQRPRPLRLDVGVFDLTEDLGFADEHRIEARADPEQMIDGLAAQQRVHVRFHVADVAMAEIRQELLELRNAGLVVFEFGVNLKPVARCNHDRFADGFVIAQRDQRLAHAVRGKGVALADFDRRGVVAET